LTPSAQAPLVFITGASSGIGQALAARYAALGWRLALVARRRDRIDAWARGLGLGADRAWSCAADVSVPAQVIGAAQACIATLGLPDVVIANAGISVGMDTRRLEDLQVMQETYATHNLGTAATFHAFLEPMRKRGSGTLVGIASVAAIRGFPGHGAYCSSKAALVSYCESLRGECRGSGIRVVTLLPGYVATPLTARNRFPMPFLISAEEFAERALGAIAAGPAYRVIPWQMAWVARGLKVLPDVAFDRLFSGWARKQRRGE
jgi:short-subunit dehydrogenase